MKTNLKNLGIALGFFAVIFGVFTHQYASAEQFQEVPADYKGIYTIDDLSNIRENLDGNYILMNNLELEEATQSEGVFFHEGLGWEPIGTTTNPFTGKFEGNGYEISGVHINNRSAEPVGLFGVAEGAEIKHLGIIQSFYQLTEPAESVSAYYSYYYGGLVGKASETVIEGSYSQVKILSNISSTYIGGLIGHMTKSDINNSFSYGNITVNRPPLDPYYREPSTTAGTLVGLSDRSSTISNSYSIGRLATFAQAYDSTKWILSKGYPTITNSYYLTNSNNKTINDSKAKSYEELLQQETYNGFDFKNTWEMGAAEEYPFPQPKGAQLQLKNNTKDFAGGMGTVFSPYLITEAAHLDAVRFHLNSYFELADDVDLSSYSSWEAIGERKEPFTGEFSGKGHVVSGLTVNLTADYELATGIFGYMALASVDGLNVRDGQLQVNRGSGDEKVYAGGIAGKLTDSIITDSSSDIDITAVTKTSGYAGGIAGHMTTSKILSSYNLGDITASTSYYGFAGGIVGMALDSEIEKVYNAGDVHSSVSLDSAIAGGLAGILVRGSLNDSYTLGAVSSSSWSKMPHTGALIGEASDSEVSNSYGIARFSEGSWGDDIAADLIGINENTAVTSSFYHNSLSGENAEAESLYLKTKDEMLLPATYEGFDLQQTWNMEGNGEYPFPVLNKPEFNVQEKANVISFKSLPDKLTYKVGEKLDLTGAVLDVESNFQRSFDVPVTTDMLSSTFYNYQLGEQRLSISYGDFSLDFTVTVEENLPENTDRISGASRYDTAIAISQNGWKTANTVLLATGADFPDALAGGPLAYKEEAPILLTRSGNLLPAVEKEIVRLGASKVIILGSIGAISIEVEEQLESIGIEVERIGGKTRFDTARLIAAKINSDKAVIAYGFNFPDVLAISPYAAKTGIPILLTRTDRIPEETKAALKHTKSTIVVGSTGAVSAAVFDQLPQADRIGGKTRFDTAKEINLKLPLGVDKAYVATGRNFPDALAGSVLAAKKNASIILVNEKTVPAATNQILSRYNDFSIFGSTGAVGDEVKTLLDQVLEKQHSIE